MKLFLSYLRLIRPVNLIIIVFTLYMVRGFFLFSGNGEPGFHPQVSDVAFALFALSFVFMACGGYIINDYYDVEIDKINKPGKVIIGNTVSERPALTTYWLVSSCGIITGFVSCYWAGVPVLGFLFLFYFIALWYYSYKLKSGFLTGNVLIALLLSLVPLGGAAIELLPRASASIYDKGEIALIWKLMGGISLVASLIALAREVVKDVEDMEGDAVADCQTMPVVIGVKKTKWMIFSLILLLNILVGYVQYACWNLDVYFFIYFLVFIQFPFIVIFYFLLKAASARDFHIISTWLKVLMVAGILYVFAVAFEFYSIYIFINSLFN